MSEWYGGPPCGRKGCDCTHEDPCDRGWIENPPRVRNGQTYASVRPCPRCKPEAAHNLAAEADRRNHHARGHH